ncbi:MAG: hypothetical protein ISQ32_04610 [Rickettsiales bacterium]|nr:hypothetical protein [Rickettsiales bacterium]
MKLKQTEQIIQIQNKIKEAFTNSNGYGPINVRIETFSNLNEEGAINDVSASQSDLKVQIAISMPTSNGRSSLNRLFLNESQFDDIINSKLKTGTTISFEAIISAIKIAETEIDNSSFQRPQILSCDASIATTNSSVSLSSEDQQLAETISKPKDITERSI